VGAEDVVARRYQKAHYRTITQGLVTRPTHPPTHLPQLLPRQPVINQPPPARHPLLQRQLSARSMGLQQGGGAAQHGVEPRLHQERARLLAVVAAQSLVVVFGRWFAEGEGACGCAHWATSEADERRSLMQPPGCTVRETQPHHLGRPCIRIQQHASWRRCRGCCGCCCPSWRGFASHRRCCTTWRGPQSDSSQLALAGTAQRGGGRGAVIVVLLEDEQLLRLDQIYGRGGVGVGGESIV